MRRPSARVADRNREHRRGRVAGWLLVLAIPPLIGLGVLLGTAMPDSEVGFSMATSVPVGVAWLLLGSSLARDTTSSSAVS